MFSLTIGNEQVTLQQVDVVDRLRGYLSAGVHFTSEGQCPEKGAAAALRIGTQTYELEVADFRWLPGGRWVLLEPAAALAPRYDLEIFSGEEGSSYQRVIESRAILIEPPPELAQKQPAIIADGTLADFLNDINARHPGWFWWTDPKGLQIGELSQETQSIDGHCGTKTPGGREVRLTDLPPRVGSRVRLPCGLEGTILHSRSIWRSGSEAEFLAVVGSAPHAERHPPRGSLHWSGKVTKLNPLIIQVVDEDRPERTFACQARQLGRRSDEGRFLEKIPLAVGDLMEATIRTGGFSNLAIKVEILSPTEPADRYVIVSHSAALEVTDHVTQSAAEFTDTFQRRTSHVTEQWNIKQQ